MGQNSSTITSKRGRELRREQRRESEGEKTRREDEYQRQLQRAEVDFDRRYEQNQCPTATLADFRILGYLGQGGNGKVYLIARRTDNDRFALKVQEKAKLAGANKRQQDYLRDMVVKEKKVGYALSNPFLMRTVIAFQDWRNLYTLMDCALYGDLVRLSGQKNPKKTVKYIAAQLILGLEYMHACRVAHRDMKLGNVFICNDIYLKIGDFGFAKKILTRSHTLLGTIGYRAPEIIKKDHGKGVDWWALGIIIFKLLYDYNPFWEPRYSDEEAAEHILNTPLTFPRGSDSQANDLIGGLLQKDVTHRLGCMIGGVNEIKDHKWFEDIHFLDVYDKRIQMTAPFAPTQPTVSNVYGFVPEGEPCGGANTNLFEGF